ncbi:MAG: hypothetical protein L3J73_00355 [Thermoplasmata archaeon]|nr:hypothetical protein [Thermoplasmata archaeon]
MRSAARTATLELPLDLVDATGLLGVLAGVLSLALPYFLGLTAALGAILFAVALRRRPESATVPPRPDLQRAYAIGFGAAVAGWVFVGLHPAALGRLVGVVLGVAGLPLWWAARRPLPFGGD